MFDVTEVGDKVRELRATQRTEATVFDEVYGFMHGRLGRPTVPAGATGDIQELARLAVKNIMPLVVDTFAHALSVDGFRSPSAEANGAAWGIWQRERMDARQSEVHRPAVMYGAAYVIVALEDSGEVGFRIRTPRQTVAEYTDPARDEWPICALETWETGTGNKTVVHGVFYDDTNAYPVTFFGTSKSARWELGDGTPHGFSVCPVVRFLNDYDPEDKVRGEVEPLIQDQRAINAVNFDRLVVSRFGAFPQKYIMGWAPDTGTADGDEAYLQALSAMRVLAIDDPEAKAGAFPAASVTAYNEILQEMIVHAALKARVNVSALTGDISNVGAETIALVDAPNQRKIGAKKRAFGESWEQALRLAATAENVDVSEDAEVVWADTDPRSFAQVVDGISKLVATGVPVTSLLDQIPGLTQQKVDAITEDVRTADAKSLAAQIVASVRGGATDAATSPAVA